MLSIPHLIIVFVVALVVFGPEKIPELARNVGKLMGEFRRATGDLRSTFEGHLRDLEREAETRRSTNAPTSNTIASSASASTTPGDSAYTASPEAAQEEISTALGAVGTVPTTPPHLGIGTPAAPSPASDTVPNSEAGGPSSETNASASTNGSSSDVAVQSHSTFADAARQDSPTLDPPHSIESLTDARTRPA